MAEKYDGDVKLKVSLTTEDVKRTALELRKILQDALSGIGDKGLSKSAKDVENSEYKIIKRADAIIAKMRELEGQTFKSDEFVELEKELAKFEQDYRKLKMKMEEHIAVGGKTSDKSFKRMQYQLQQLENQIEGTKYEMEELKDWGTAFIPGTQTAEYAELARQLNAINAEMTAVKSSESNISAEHIDNLGQSTEKASNGVRRLIDRFMEFMRMLGGTTSEMQRSSDATQQQTEKTEQLVESQKRVESSAKGAANSVRQISTRKTIDGLNGLKDAFNRVRHGSNQFERGLKRGIRTFIKYAFGVRSVFFLYRKLRAAVMEGFKNLQEYSDPLKQSIQSLKDSLGQLKNQLAASFSPIVTAVLPYIQTFVNALNAAISKVGQFIAALAGKKTWTRAKLVSTAVSDGMGDAANATGAANEAAQEYKKTLMGFDDVNILQEPDKGSGSGGGAGAGGINQVNPEDMFEEVGIDSGIMGIADALRSMVEEGNWYGVGQTIANKLKETLENIPWDDIYEKASNFGTNLASFLNGLFDPELFYDVGSTIASALNTAIIFVTSLGEEFDGVNFGNALAQLVNGWLETFDFKTLGHGISVWVKNFTDTIGSFIANIEWGDVFGAVGEFLEGLGFEGVMRILGLVSTLNFFKHAKTGIKSLLKSNVKSGAKEGISEGIKEGASAAQNEFEGYTLSDIRMGVQIGLSILSFLDTFGNPFTEETIQKEFDKQWGIELSKDEAKALRADFGVDFSFEGLKEQVTEFYESVKGLFNGEGWQTSAKTQAQHEFKRLGLKQIFLDGLAGIGDDAANLLHREMSTMVFKMQELLKTSGLYRWLAELMYGKDAVDELINADTQELINAMNEGVDQVNEQVHKNVQQMQDELLDETVQKLKEDGFELSDESKRVVQRVTKKSLDEAVRGINSGSTTIAQSFGDIRRISVKAMTGNGPYGNWQGEGSAIVNQIKNGALREQVQLAGGIQQVVVTAQGVLYKLVDGSYVIGEQIPAGLGSGLAKEAYRANKAMEDLSKGIQKQAKVTMEIASPSKWMEREIGNNITLGIANGITGKQSNANTAISKIGTGLQNTVKNLKLYDAFKSIGINIVQGIIDGMSAKDKIATQKIANVVNNVKNKGKNVAVVSSPSKWFRNVIGQNITLGLALGIEDEEQKAVNAMERVSMAVNKAGATAIPAVVRGAVVPHTALSGTASTAAAVANKPITRDELETMLSRVVAKYMNIDFYIGDEQISRHADAGKQKIGKKYNPVLA